MHDAATDPEVLLASHDTDRHSRSVAPCDTYILSLTDVRSRYVDEGDPVSASRVLHAWAVAFGEFNGKQVFGEWSRKDVAQHVTYLRNNLTTIAGTPAVVRFATHVAATHKALRRVMR
jgi:hypothetical protein